MIVAEVSFFPLGTESPSPQEAAFVREGSGEEIVFPGDAREEAREAKKATVRSTPAYHAKSLW